MSCWRVGGDAGDYGEVCGGQMWWSELLTERELESKCSLFVTDREVERESFGSVNI